MVAEMKLASGLVADAGEMAWVQGLSARIPVGAERTTGCCALVEHTIPPRSLGAPLHTHADEDEISYVLAGRVGVQIGEETLEAGPGAVVVKPRGVPHAFWNAGEEPARLIELITPGGFEGYFAGAAAMFAGAAAMFAGAAAMFAATCRPDPATAGALMGRYKLQMDVASIPALIQAHGLVG